MEKFTLSFRTLPSGLMEIEFVGQGISNQKLADCFATVFRKDPRLRDVVAEAMYKSIMFESDGHTVIDLTNNN